MVDYATPRMFAPGCEEKSDIRYFLQLKRKSEEGPAEDEIIDKSRINPKLGYGIIHVRGLEKGKYEVKIIRKGKHEEAKDFTISVYTDRNPVTELSKFHLLMSSLQSA